MAIDLEKILTISAKEYCEMYQKNITDFEAKGIHYLDYGGSGDCLSVYGDNRTDINTLKAFAKMIPPEAEVVVGFIPSLTQNQFGMSYAASATALIPKNKH